MTGGAAFSPAFDAREVARRPLSYRDGACTVSDRAAHVRAGSAVVRVGPRTLAIVQDDASFVAWVDTDAWVVTDTALPSPSGVRQFDDGRGNKAGKLDLEAALFVPSARLLVAFGSGSTARRERVALVPTDGVAPPRVVEAPLLYATLRGTAAFAGSELNVEGATVHEGDVVFFQRGNGLGPAVDATGRMALGPLLAHLAGDGACPPLTRIASWNLGALGGVRLTFTDGTVDAGGHLAFAASAEASPDATRDGPVAGSVLGRLDERTGATVLGRLLGRDGAPLRDKVEGLAFDPSDAARAFAVVDSDAPDVPCVLLELALGDGWSR